MVKNSSSSLTQKLLNLELFARPVRLTHNGQDTYKSGIGAAFTVICLILVFMYAMFKTPPLFDDKDTTMTSN